jgi:carbonic anhydrase
MSDFYKKILDNNKNGLKHRWLVTLIFFCRLAKGQTPPLLWIGSDSRVPANEIVGAKPGEVFCSS